jgi:hypothetical protein
MLFILNFNDLLNDFVSPTPCLPISPSFLFWVGPTFLWMIPTHKCNIATLRNPLKQGRKSVNFQLRPVPSTSRPVKYILKLFFKEQPLKGL